MMPFNACSLSNYPRNPSLPISMRLGAKLLWLGALLVSLCTSPALATERLITAGGTLTDIVFALGEENRLLAIDDTSTSPDAAAQLPKIGYFRSLSTEGVLKFEPDTFWGIAGTGSDKTLQQLKAIGVEVEIFPRPQSVEEFFSLLTDIGARLGKSRSAEQLIDALRRDIGQPKPQGPLSALFVLQASERGIVAAGTNTVPAVLMNYNGLVNIASHEGFKPLSIEHIALNPPDFIVAPAHTVATAGGAEAFCNNPQMRLVPAANSCTLLVMDALLTLGMTTQLPKAINELGDFASQLVAPPNATAHDGGSD
ncbi:MAG TPA: ABC transporter substrate-binding protein [Marinagarivorans sp.]